MSNEVVLVAYIEARPGKEDELEAVLKSVQAPTHAEPGCRVYAVHRSAAKPGRFIFIERWANQAALDSHLASSHIQAALSRQNELMSVFEIEILLPMPATTHPAGKI